MTPSMTPERGKLTPESCADCIAASLRMKEQGFRDWRTAYACDEHSWLNIDEAFAAMGYVPDEDEVRKACKSMGIPYMAPASAGDQLELFGQAA